MNRAVLLTGATGFLGRELLKQLVEELPTEQTVYCLIRGQAESKSAHPSGQAPSQQAQAEARLHKLLAELGYPDLTVAKVARVRAVGGDISQPRLGADHEVLDGAHPARRAHLSRRGHGALRSPAGRSPPHQRRRHAPGPRADAAHQGRWRYDPPELHRHRVCVRHPPWPHLRERAFTPTSPSTTPTSRPRPKPRRWSAAT
jgi:hypothetical protein